MKRHCLHLREAPISSFSNVSSLFMIHKSLLSLHQSLVNRSPFKSAASDGFKCESASTSLNGVWNVPFFTRLGMLDVNQLANQTLASTEWSKTNGQTWCFNAFIRVEEKAAKRLEFYPLSLSLPGSCHGAVPSQLTAPLAGAAPVDYERHYKV